MHFSENLFVLLGILSAMLYAGVAAAVVGQAFIVGYVIQGMKMLRKKQVITGRDVLAAMGDDAVWLSVVVRYPVASILALATGVAVYRSGLTQPGWVMNSVVAGFVLYGPGFAFLRKLLRPATLALAVQAAVARKQTPII